MLRGESHEIISRQSFLIFHNYHIMGMDGYSDYSSSNSEQYSPWGSAYKPSPARSSSFIEGMTKNLDAVMLEFRMNGSDSPYDPDEELLAHRKGLTGMGPSSMYLRQKSWPAPDSTPAVRLPRGADSCLPDRPTVTEAPILAPPPAPPSPPALQQLISEQQMRVLRSLPNAVLYPLLRELERSRRAAGSPEEQLECRFCKNNGERPAYYRSHALRAAGRVACPVLRAFVCRRCGAHGDRAHTLKYCPLTTAEERSKSAAMMRSVRAARRRGGGPELVVFGETTPSVLADGREALPLDPMWAALEQKLML